MTPREAADQVARVQGAEKAAGARATVLGKVRGGSFAWGVAVQWANGERKELFTVKEIDAWLTT